MKCWTDISEMPVWNYHKVLQTQDLRYLMKQPGAKLTAKQQGELKGQWKKLQDAYIDKFGVSKRYAAIERKRLGIERLILQHLATGDKALLPVIEIRKKELREMLAGEKSEKQQSFEEQVVAIEMYFRFPIDTRKVSVVRYYTYLQVFEKEIQRLKLGGNGK